MDSLRGLAEGERVTRFLPSNRRLSEEDALAVGRGLETDLRAARSLDPPFLGPSDVLA